LALTQYFGPTPVETAVERCEGWLEQADRLGTADLHTYLAGLNAMQGRFDDAKSLANQARATYEEFARASIWATWAPIAADVDALAGNVTAAEHTLLEACSVLGPVENPGLLSERAGMLAAALVAQGKIDEAQYWVDISAANAASGDIGAHVRWRAAKATIVMQRGSLDHAEALAREAARLAERTDRLNLRADALLALAEVLGVAGHESDAARRVEEALALYERKGNSVSADQARARFAGLSVA
jgi:tetratricopeptide (TPR) repeat protein